MQVCVCVCGRCNVTNRLDDSHSRQQEQRQQEQQQQALCLIAPVCCTSASDSNRFPWQPQRGSLCPAPSLALSLLLSGECCQCWWGVRVCGKLLSELDLISARSFANFAQPFWSGSKQATLSLALLLFLCLSCGPEPVPSNAVLSCPAAAPPAANNRTHFLCCAAVWHCTLFLCTLSAVAAVSSPLLLLLILALPSSSLCLLSSLVTQNL